MIYKVGDLVLLKRDITIGDVFLPKGTGGIIKGITKKTFGKDQFAILWYGTNFNVTMNGEKDFRLGKVL